MHGLENLKEEVVKRAKSQAITIVGGAKAEALRITKDAEIKIYEYRKKAEEEAKQTIESINKKELTAAELESKKMLLESKKSIIEKTVNLAKSKIEEMSDSKRSELINAVYKKASKEIDVGTVYCSKKDSKFIKGVDEGVDVKVQDMLGGVIAENKDKTIRVDYSFEDLLESIKENSMREIAEALF